MTTSPASGTGQALGTGLVDLAAALTAGPPAGVVRRRGLVAEMPDGVCLVADAWHPASGGPWPVLLQRLPYGREVASSPVLPAPAQLARLGYAVVVQDVRGRGGSGGTFTPFANEGADGAASIEWAAGLEFSTGEVVTYGFSYQGVDQVAAAARRPRGLVAIAPMMCAPEPAGMLYEGGCLRWAATASWAAQLASQAPNQGPGGPLRRADVEALPLVQAIGPAPPAWYEDWVSQPPDGRYWALMAPDLAAVEVPVFTVLGYADTFSPGTAALISRLRAEAVCGPWAHMPWGTRLSGIEFTGASPAVAIDAFLAFVARSLGRPSARPGPASHDRLKDQRVCYFVVGEGWRSSSSWPPRAERRLFHGLSGCFSGQGANSRHGDGVLIEGAGPRRLSDSVVSEPLAPHPGETEPYPDRAASEDRRDVLCYTSEPFASPVVLAGNPVVTLAAWSDAPTFDLFTSLVYVTGDGVARRLSYGATRLRPGQVDAEARVELRPVAWALPKGARLRLDISATCFPLFARNPQEADIGGAGAGLVGREGYRVATIEVTSVSLEVPLCPDAPEQSASPNNPEGSR